MRTAEWIHLARLSLPLVVIDMQMLIDEYGRDAFWEARERQKGRVPDLGRGPDHWRQVADEIADRQGIFGAPN